MSQLAITEVPFVEQVVFVVRIFEDRRRPSNDRWFYTVSRDAIRIYTSPPMSESEANEKAAGVWK